MPSLKERRAQGNEWRMRRSQGDTQEKGQSVYPQARLQERLPEFSRKGPRARKVQQKTSAFPLNSQGYRDPTLGNWNCIFPALELPSHPRNNGGNRVPIAGGTRSLSSVLSLPSSFADPAWRVVPHLPHGQAVSSTRWGSSLISHTPNSHAPRAVCKFSIIQGSQILAKHTDLGWARHRFICNSQPLLS